MARYSAKQIGRIIIDYAKDCPKEVDDFTHLKLHKLLFYTQGWWMANYHEALFGDTIEAWKYGPVVPKIYHLLKTKDARNPTITLDKDEYNEMEKNDNFEKVESFTHGLFDVYADSSPYEMIELTHREAIWLDNYNPDPYTSSIIDPYEMQKYFERRLKYARDNKTTKTI